MIAYLIQELKLTHPCRVYAVTQIPLGDLANGARQSTPSPSSRPAWIRPIRKKASAAPLSNHSAGSSSPHNSSPEAFSPSEFFNNNEPAKPTSPFTNSSTAPAPTATTQLSPPIQYHGPNLPPAVAPTSFNMGMDVIQEDPQLYLSHGDMVNLSLFNDGAIDVNQLFSSDFNIPVNGPGQQRPQQGPCPPDTPQAPSSVGDRQGGGGGASGNIISSSSAGFSGANTYIKMPVSS